MKKIMFTEVMRPRSSSGVSSWRSVWRTTMLTVSAAPLTASSTSDSGSHGETPKPATAAP